MRIVLLAAALMAAATMAEADQFYKCTDAQGRVTYAQDPCGKQAEAIEVTVDRPDRAEVRRAQRRAAEAVAITDEIMRQRNRARALARQAQLRAARKRKRAEAAAEAEKKSRATSGRYSVIARPMPRAALAPPPKKGKRPQHKPRRPPPKRRPPPPPPRP